VYGDKLATVARSALRTRTFFNRYVYGSFTITPVQCTRSARLNRVTYTMRMNGNSQTLNGLRSTMGRSLARNVYNAATLGIVGTPVKGDSQGQLAAATYRCYL
jgi:hypothetical protein